MHSDTSDINPFCFFVCHVNTIVPPPPSTSKMIPINSILSPVGTPGPTVPAATGLNQIYYRTSLGELCHTLTLISGMNIRKSVPAQYKPTAEMIPDHAMLNVQKKKEEKT